MDEGAENNMDVPDSVSQRDDPVALEEDNAKLKIWGVWISPSWNEYFNSSTHDFYFYYKMLFVVTK